MFIDTIYNQDPLLDYETDIVSLRLFQHYCVNFEGYNGFGQYWGGDNKLPRISAGNITKIFAGVTIQIITRFNSWINKRTGS